MCEGGTAPPPPLERKGKEGGRREIKGSAMKLCDSKCNKVSLTWGRGEERGEERVEERGEALRGRSGKGVETGRCRSSLILYIVKDMSASCTV